MPRRLTDAYIVEAVCQYFDVEDTLASPHVLQIPEDSQVQAKMGLETFHVLWSICRGLIISSR